MKPDEAVTALVELLDQELRPAVWVAVRGPGHMRLLGVYWLSEQAKRRCEQAHREVRAVAFNHNVPIEWEPDDYGWHSQDFPATKAYQRLRYWVQQMEVR